MRAPRACTARYAGAFLNPSPHSPTLCLLQGRNGHDDEQPGKPAGNFKEVKQDLKFKFLWWKSLKQMFEILMKQNGLFKNLLKNFPNTR